MKKRFLASALALVMALSLLPLNALAEDYSAGNFVPGETTLVKGDTYTLDTDDASNLPEAPEGLRWDGPESIKGDRVICGKNAHQHNSNCYKWEWFLIPYRKLVCNKEEHTHSDYCYNHTYKWKLVDEKENTTSNTWRRWWPVYWTLSQSDRINANDAIESVTAGKNVAYTKRSLNSKEALTETTATLGNAVDAGGFTITTKPGYYVKAARVVCGNYTGCGVSGELVPTEQTKDNYSNTIAIRFDQESGNLNFDHLLASEVNLPKNYPTLKPDPADGWQYNWLDGNTLYPYYFLIQVAQDPTTYSVSYDWGSLDLKSQVPNSDNQLKRNESYEVLAPSKEAIAEAAEKNLAFAGWAYNNSGRIYQVGESFSVLEDVTLTAQWTQLYTVSYELDGGKWKAGETVENANYPENAPVSVTSYEPGRAGHTFTGWKSNIEGDNNVYKFDGTNNFTMPAANVVLRAQWELIEAAELSVKKEVTSVGNAAVEKDATGNPIIPTAYPGDEIVWTITVTNSGNAAGNFTLKETLSGITVKDITTNTEVKPNTDGEWSGTVAAGESVSYTVTYTVKATDVTDNGLVNTVTMNGTEEKSDPVPTAMKYTVTYDLAGGKIGTDATYTDSSSPYAKDATVTVASDPTKEGHTFAGWTATTDNTSVGAPAIDETSKTFTMPAANVTLTAQWETKSDLSYTVNYLEKGTNKVLHNPKTEGNQTFGTEITSSKEVIDINGYKYDSVDKDSLTIGTDESKNVINIYYTKRTDLSYTVKYVDKITGSEIQKPVLKGGMTFGDKVIGASEKVNIANYTYVEAKPDLLTISTDVAKNVITLYYTKNAPTPGTFDFNDVVSDDGKVTPAITKTVKGNVGRNFKETFKVTVEPKSDNAKNTMTLASYTGKADVTYADLTSAFKFAANDKLTFSAADTYTYTVQEVKGETGRMSYDTTKYFLTIEVELDTEANKYKVTSWKFDTNKGAGTPLNIVNTYRAYQPSTPSVTKPALNTDDHYAYVMGYPDGTVQPGGYITRAEASTIFFRLLTDATREEYWAVSNEYTDVKDGDWYNNAISTLSNAGIVSGYPDGTFRPNAPITRAEMSKIIALFAKLDKTNDRFTDIAGHWAEAYIRLAAGNGWIEGYPDGSFRPNQSITRAETVTMINRVLERVPSEEDHLLSERVMLTFPDCKSGQWFYIAIQEATNSHTYERAVTEKNGDEQWIALRDNRDWTKLEY